MGMEFVYVLHFNADLAHAKHYAGSTRNLTQRLTAHANGHGSRITRELFRQGVGFELGGLYSTTHAQCRRLEKELKSMHQAWRFCQLCNPIKQANLPGTQKENVFNVKKRTSIQLLTSQIELHHTAELEIDKEEFGMEYILKLMRQDKDALGFVPVGGEKGIKALLHKQQIILTYEDTKPAGYSFYTIGAQGVSIHQCCVDDYARLKGHGTSLVEYIAAKHPELAITAKVRDDLAANHFWNALGFEIIQTVTHATSGNPINHYRRKPK